VIELLNEQKQAIIQRVVTRGLDPNVRLKPSRVEWFGEIPAHWDIKPLKFLSSRIQNGATPSTSDRSYYEDGTVAWYGPSSIGTSIEIGVPARFLNHRAISDGNARLIQGNAIAIIVIGATAGKMALMKNPGTTNQQITCFKLISGIVNPEFAILQTRLAESWLRSTASTATIPILDSNVVCRIPVALPPIIEQVEIVERVRELTYPLSASIGRLTNEIALLREYRTRLIADVVTGKLDVRGVELPELGDVQEVSDVEDEELEDSEELVAVEENVDAD
jgi:type I restriction enzyme S subunit